MKLRTFKCDLPKCKKKIEIVEGEETYPYKKGWVYIFNLEIKVGKSAKIIHGDAHYCSQEHMLEHIKKGVENRIASIKILKKDKKNLKNSKGGKN